MRRARRQDQSHPDRGENIGADGRERAVSMSDEIKITEEGDERVVINAPPFCERHVSKLVHGAGYTDEDPWRAMVLVAQIVLFQCATTKASIWRKIEGDVNRLAELGCL